MHAILFSFLLFLSVYLRLCLSFHLTCCISLRLFLCVFFHNYVPCISFSSALCLCLSLSLYLYPSLSSLFSLAFSAFISFCVYTEMTHELTARFTNDAAQYES